MPPGETAAGTPSVDIAALSPRLAAENPEPTTRLVQPGSLEELRAIRESLPPVGFGLDCSALPTAAGLDPSVEFGAIEDLFDGANGKANAVPHGVPAIRPPSRHEAIAPITRENGLGSLLVVLASSALLATVGWLLTVKSVPCLLADVRYLAMPATTAASTVAHKIITIESNGNANHEWKHPSSGAAPTET